MCVCGEFLIIYAFLWGNSDNLYVFVGNSTNLCVFVGNYVFVVDFVYN